MHALHVDYFFIKYCANSKGLIESYVITGNFQRLARTEDGKDLFTKKDSYGRGLYLFVSDVDLHESESKKLCAECKH